MQVSSGFGGKVQQALLRSRSENVSTTHHFGRCLTYVAASDLTTSPIRAVQLEHEGAGINGNRLHHHGLRIDCHNGHCVAKHQGYAAAFGPPRDMLSR